MAKTKSQPNSYLMSLGLWQLNRLLDDGLTNCSKDFLKFFILVELSISVSNYFIQVYQKPLNQKPLLATDETRTTKLHGRETRKPRKIMWRPFITI